MILSLRGFTGGMLAPHLAKVSWTRVGPGADAWPSGPPRPTAMAAWGAVPAGDRASLGTTNNRARRP
jgi:hypothetical protein